MTILYGEGSIFQKPQKMQEDLHSQEFALIISVLKCAWAITILKRRRIMKEKETDVGRSPIQQSYLYPYLWFVLWRFLWGLQPYAKEKKTIPEVMSITLQKHNSRTQIIIKCEGNDHLSVNVWTKAFNGRSLSSTDRSSHNWYYNRLLMIQVVDWWEQEPFHRECFYVTGTWFTDDGIVIIIL